MTHRLCWLLLSLALALPARAQSDSPSRFDSPELGAALHLRLTPDVIHDGLGSAAISLLGAPLPWLVLEAGLDGMFSRFASTRTLFAQTRVRLVRRERTAIGMGAGIEWNRTPDLTDRARNGEVSPASFWSLPVEASIEVRPKGGLTVRSYLGVRVPLPGFNCAGVELGPICRAHTTLYLGASFGWAHRFVGKPQPVE